MDKKLVILVSTAVAGHSSRASARTLTLGLGLGMARDVTLDFDGVIVLGRDFVDEVFHVFAVQNPHIRMTAVNLKPSAASLVWGARTAAMDELRAMA